MTYLVALWFLRRGAMRWSYPIFEPFVRTLYFDSDRNHLVWEVEWTRLSLVLVLFSSRALFVGPPTDPFFARCWQEACCLHGLHVVMVPIRRFVHWRPFYLSSSFLTTWDGMVGSHGSCLGFVFRVRRLPSTRWNRFRPTPWYGHPNPLGIFSWHSLGSIRKGGRYPMGWGQGGSTTRSSGRWSWWHRAHRRQHTWTCAHARAKQGHGVGWDGMGETEQWKGRTTEMRARKSPCVPRPNTCT